MRKLTYKKAGVDIGKASAFKKGIKALVRRSFRAEVLQDIGGFGGLFRFPRAGFKDPVLVSSTDGVGTKLKIAMLAGRHDTVGIDLVAMNVNDILCTGAEPLFFLDYIAAARLDPALLSAVVKGISDGCIRAGCSLIGGETAEMPGMYAHGEYDLAGFCVGVVDRKDLIDGSRIRAKDKIIGLASSGFHSNGYSLVREALSGPELKRMSRSLLVPTRIYVKEVLGILRGPRGRQVTAIAHITGGAFYDKIARVLPSGVDAILDKRSWQVPRIFRTVQEKGGIPEQEMYHTFNMGIGMVLFVRPEAAPGIQVALKRLKLSSWIIGETQAGRKQVAIA